MIDTAIILAAGESSRMGRPKALLEWRGQTLLARLLDITRQAGLAPLVVLGAHAERLRAHVGDAEVVFNEAWREGMGRSIARGAGALDPCCERAVVLTVDQPQVDAELLRELLAACSTEVDAAATRYPDGPLGPPVCFREHVFSTLRSLGGDGGARRFLRSDDWNVAQVRADGAGVDIDTPEQWKQFKRDHNPMGHT
ncbi:MAG: NTP transferase domain-containing protein [Persicimonas sp.]